MPAELKNPQVEEAARRIEEARRSGATHINLSGLGLSAIPHSLAQLPELQTIFLSNNQITAVPDSLGRLAHLDSLDLSANQITAIPDSLAALKNLTHLFLHGNPNLGIPPEVLGPTPGEVFVEKK